MHVDDGRPHLEVEFDESRVDEAQRQLNHTSVRAPFAGVVTQVDALQPGTYLVVVNETLDTQQHALVGASLPQRDRSRD